MKSDRLIASITPTCTPSRMHFLTGDAFIWVQAKLRKVQPWERLSQEKGPLTVSNRNSVSRFAVSFVFFPDAESAVSRPSLVSPWKECCLGLGCCVGGLCPFWKPGVWVLAVAPDSSSPSVRTLGSSSEDPCYLGGRQGWRVQLLCWAWLSLVSQMQNLEKTVFTLKNMKGKS